MATANVHQAKTNLSKLLDAAARGEEVVITRRSGSGVTEFRLVAVAPPARASLFGALAGRVVFSPDYDSADEEITDLFAESAGS